jgi:integrase
MITESQIKAAIRKAAASPGKTIELKDGGERGAGRLALQVRGRQTHTSVEFYAVWHRSGRRAYVKIGSYPTLSLGEARRRFRTEYSPTISSGADPASQNVRRRHNPAAPSATVEELFKTYIADLRRAGKRSAGGIKRILLSETCGAARAIGKDRLAATVTPADIVAVLKDIHDRGAPVMAHTARAYLGAAFAFGLTSPYDYRSDIAVPSWGLTINPAAAVKPDDTAARACDRFLTPAEFRAFWLWLMGHGKNSRLAYAARIHMTTGQRVEEVLRMSAASFDRGTRTYHWDKTKNGLPHTIPLPAVVIEILDELTPNRHGLYFPNAAKPDMPAYSGGLLDVINRYVELNGAAKFTARDIRRTWKTLAGRAGVSKEMRDKIQNHAQRTDVGSRNYDRWSYAPEKRAAMTVWAAFMDRIIAGEVEDAVVVPFEAVA